MRSMRSGSGSTVIAPRPMVMANATEAQVHITPMVQQDKGMATTQRATNAKLIPLPTTMTKPPRSKERLHASPRPMPLGPFSPPHLNDLLSALHDVSFDDGFQYQHRICIIGWF